jgi:hypothetical protein
LARVTIGAVSTVAPKSPGMNTKQAKNFLAQRTAEQAALDNVSLSEIEVKMMYFTESDPASCDNPLEVNNEFEAQYDTAEYEIKISRLVHRAYERVKTESPERRRMWDQAVHELRKGDHYFLVLWDTTPPSEHPTRDFFKFIGVGLLAGAAIVITIVLAVKYNVDGEWYREYAFIAVVGFVLIVSGVFRNIYRVAFVLFHRLTSKDE